ncbi:MAG TPA: bifunctional diguanylate cyclase/phosphodiesterase [Gammaproteobacteria bacterium]|nr:bifunctional diguanylate cyclase/phosphodiesterase [Gammaproteobacteria bacterium]
MQQRTKLLIGSLASSLGTIALFTGIAFTSALDFTRHQIPGLLHEHNQHLIEMLPETPSLEQIQAMLPHHETRSDNLSVIDAEGRLLTTPGQRSSVPIDTESLLAASSGFATIDDEEYIWASTPVPGTPYTIVNTHRRSQTTLHDFMKHIGVPIAFAALISIWLTTWGAMVIASLFRRLNEQHAQLEHQARHDPLTGLPNRDALSQTIDETIARQDGGPQTLAVCMIDLQQFKEINDSLGHHCGDELLRQVAKRLNAVLQAPDQAARFYGNKFAIMLNDAGEAAIDDIAETLLGTLENAFEIDGRCLYIRGTLGVALYPQHATTAPALLQKAEAAIFQARQNAHYAAIFQALDNKGAAERLGLINDLRNALRDGQLELHYQPRLDLRSQQIIGAEALARWTHPQHGFIPPDQFIEIAERTGLIKELTRWVLETALQQCAHCHANGWPVNISANLSAINLHDEELVPLIASLLDRHQLPAHNLVVEITETAMMADPARARAQLRKLDTLGVCISIDDFGTGYSSLGHLRQLPVDEIKIDKSFVMDMIASEDDASIVRATIGLAHDLGLEVVAEGVENEAILKQLNGMGCDIAQGYHIARPLPAAEFITVLERIDSKDKPAAALR